MNGAERERGNVFFMLFGAVAMLGVLVAGVSTFVQGPLSTTVKVTRASMAEGQIHIAARLAVLDSAEDPGDCDDDGFIEPKGYVEAAPGQPFPAGGGHMPMVGAAQSDPWGTPYGYCAWDMGQINDICPGNRREGPGMHETDLEQQSRPVLAIISAGSDRTFDTECLDYNPSHPDGPDQRLVVTPPGSEDIVFTYTYAEARGASAGLWQLKPGDPTIATIDRDVEIGTGRLRFGTEDLWGGTLGDLNVALACDSPQHVNTMRFNPFENTIEVCRNDGGWGWEPLSGSGDGSDSPSGGVGVASFASGLSRIATSHIHACGIKPDGSAWCWGNTDSGRLGYGEPIELQQPVPVPIAESGPWVAISASNGEYTCAIKAEGSAWCWGNGDNGKLGYGGSDAQDVPVLVDEPGPWTMISTGHGHACGLKADGTAWCWGQDWGSGKLGVGATYNEYTPRQLPDTGPWIQISAGGSHSCGIKDDHSLWCWGSNNVGQLGLGTSDNHNTPQEVPGDHEWIHVSTGGSPWGSASTCAIRRDGSLWCWGNGDHGKLGYGGTENQNEPIAVAEPGPWAGVYVGGWQHTCGVKVDGSAWCWGEQSGNHQLGYGGTESQSTPVRVLGSGNYIAVRPGILFTCGVKADLSAWCWGGNYEGQLGNGRPPESFNSSPHPVPVSGWMENSGGGLWSLHDNGDDIYYTDGNVGIGTEEPQTALDVAGIIRTSDRVRLGGTTGLDAPANTTVSGGGGSGDGLWQESDDDIYYSSGNVGIGTSAPESMLDIAGGIRLGDDSDDCVAGKTGAIRFISGTSRMEVCREEDSIYEWSPLSHYDPEEVGFDYPAALLSSDRDAALGLLDGSWSSYPPWPHNIHVIGFSQSGQPIIAMLNQNFGELRGIFDVDGNNAFFGATYVWDGSNMLVDGSATGLRVNSSAGLTSLFSFGEPILHARREGHVQLMMNAEEPRPCNNQLAHGGIAMTSTGRLCTCTTDSGWRNAADTAACSW